MKEQYSLDLLNQIFNYLSNFEELGIDIKNINILSPKDRKVIEKVQHIYDKTKLFRDYKLIKLSPLEEEDTLLYANELLGQIFPSKKREINLLDEKLDFQDISYGEAGLYYHIVKHQVDTKKIIIPEECSGYTVSIIGHEKTHALTFSSLNLIELFQGYLELFPTLIQKIILYEFENTYGFTYVSDLDTKIRICDCKQALLNFYYARDLMNDSERTELDEYVSHYFRIKAIDYLQAELFSELLLKEYRNNSDKMLNYLNQLFGKKISLEEFLSRYQISLLNKSLISTVKETTNKVRRLSIIL